MSFDSWIVESLPLGDVSFRDGEFFPYHRKKIASRWKSSDRGFAACSGIIKCLQGKGNPRFIIERGFGIECYPAAIINDYPFAASDW
jgi:hypothetical protein